MKKAALVLSLTLLLGLIAIYPAASVAEGEPYTLYFLHQAAKDAARMKDTGLYQDTDIKEPIAAIVTAHSPRIDTAVAFLEYLFDYPACADSK